jgi:hypothetical protein
MITKYSLSLIPSKTMRLNFITGLSAVSTLLGGVTAHPAQDLIVIGKLSSPPLPVLPSLTLPPDSSNSTLTPRILRPRVSGEITLELGTKPRNVGTRVNKSLYNELFSALQVACGRKSQKSCGTTSKPPSASFDVFVPVGDQLKREKFVVYMQSAFWDANVDIYMLLVDAVAGAATRGTWSPYNCYEWNGYNRYGKATYNFCNTIDRVNVGFNGKYWMNVTLDSTRTSGTVDCWAIRSAGQRYLENNIHAKVEKAMGLRDGELWVHDECIL